MVQTHRCLRTVNTKPDTLGIQSHTPTSLCLVQIKVEVVFELLLLSPVNSLLLLALLRQTFFFSAWFCQSVRLLTCKQETIKAKLFRLHCSNLNSTRLTNNRILNSIGLGSKRLEMIHLPSQFHTTDVCIPNKLCLSYSPFSKVHWSAVRAHRLSHWDILIYKVLLS